MRALIASGTGRYADPWHPFPTTSPLLAEILSECGFDTTIGEDIDGALADLDDVDLLVVNAGDPWRSGEEDLPQGASGPGELARAVENGLGILALHCAVATLRDYPVWAAAIGGMWVPSCSWHPPLGTARITGHSLPGGETIADFDVEDERYTKLQMIGTSHVVATHEGPAGPEPTAWVRTFGQSRIAVDTLGHDERSYRSPGHRALVKQLASWAVGQH